MNEPVIPPRDELPTKYVAYGQEVRVRCVLRYIDLEGLSDGRSIKTILPQVAPRKLVCFLTGCSTRDVFFCFLFSFWKDAIDEYSIFSFTFFGTKSDPCAWFTEGDN